MKIKAHDASFSRDSWIARGFLQNSSEDAWQSETGKELGPTEYFGFGLKRFFAERFRCFIEILRGVALEEQGKWRKHGMVFALDIPLAEIEDGPSLQFEPVLVPQTIPCSQREVHQCKPRQTTKPAAARK